MTDIWRSFIAQRCFGSLVMALRFTDRRAFRQRNMHSLLRDFEEEIPGYLNNNRIISILEKTQLAGGTECN